VTRRKSTWGLLALAGVAVLAVIAIEAGGGSGSGSSAESGRIVKSSDRISPTNTAGEDSGAPKTYWPSPNSTPSKVKPTAGSESRESSEGQSPCGLVSGGEAAAILGKPVDVSVGAQGPTCIYTAQNSTEMTLVVEPVSLAGLKSSARSATPVQVAGRSGWCLQYGDTSVAVSLGDGRVLNVTGPCASASRFAALALERVPALS
jgi:hypothetical protein